MKLYLSIAASLFLLNTAIGQEVKPTSNTGEISISEHPNIKKLVHIKFSENYEDNFKIQLYYGNLNKAHEILREFNKKYNEISAKIIFETPNYKVWAGDFRTRLKAEKALMTIQNEFKSAFIFKPKK